MQPKPAVVKSVVGKVGIVIAGKIETTFLRDAIVKALTIEGISGSIFVSVDELSVLPYAAQTMSKKCDVVIASAFMAGDTSGSTTDMIQGALLQLGMVGTVPIIPALVHQESLLEAKAVLSTLATSWAKSASSILGLSSVVVADAPVIVIEQPPVLTPTVTSTDTLLAILKESLKV